MEVIGTTIKGTAIQFLLNTPCHAYSIRTDYVGEEPQFIPEDTIVIEVYEETDDMDRLMLRFDCDTGEPIDIYCHIGGVMVANDYIEHMRPILDTDFDEHPVINNVFDHLSEYVNSGWMVYGMRGTYAIVSYDTYGVDVYKL